MGRGIVMSRRIQQVILYGVVPAILLAMTAGAMRFRDYVRRDPGFCGQCHQVRDEFALWSQKAHRTIVCQECHHQSDREALSVLVDVVVGRRAPGLHAPTVPRDACATCHLSHDRRWPDVGGSQGHRVHATREKISCQRCHARAIHQAGVMLDSCRECHEKQAIRSSGMERLHCLSCHNFLTADEESKPARSSCLRCHNSRALFDTTFPENAPMAKLACWSCHRPHVDDKPSYVSCGSCHEKQRNHGLHRVDEHATCSDCHRPHTWISERRQCVRCHDDLAAHFPNKECGKCHSFTAAAP
jgi:hypothetical protein